MVFKLFASCIPVDGARRSVVCDIQRGVFRFIPNVLFEILTQYKDRPLNEIKSAYNNEHDKVIDSYFDFLEDNEFGFWCDSPDEFPDLDRNWKYPSAITNAVIDVNENSNHNFTSISDQFNALGCDAVQIRLYHQSTIEELRSILNAFSAGRLKTIEFVAGYSLQLTYRALTALCQKHQRLHAIIVHSSPFARKMRAKGIKTSIIYSMEKIIDHRFCGNVHPTYFVVNLPGFLEAQKFNSCLNRKVGIDVAGNIKNCPSMNISYGNINEKSIEQITSTEKFRSMWTITKDHVSVCKDCEFRYICPDCRVFTEKEDPLGKPSKCKYDPYKATWEN